MYSLISAFVGVTFVNEISINARSGPHEVPSRFFFKHGEVKVKFTLEQAMKAQRGSRDIALLFL